MQNWLLNWWPGALGLNAFSVGVEEPRVERMGASSKDAFPGYLGPPGKNNKHGLSWAMADTLVVGLDALVSPKAQVQQVSTPSPSPSPPVPVKKASMPRRVSIAPVLRPLKFLTHSTTSSGGASVESDVVELELKLDDFTSINPGVGGRIEGQPFSVGGHQWCGPSPPRWCGTSALYILYQFLFNKRRDAV